MAETESPSWVSKLPRETVIGVNTLSILTVLVAYGLWIKRGCVAFLPFLSDLGLRAPESTFFTAAIAVCGPMVAIILISEVSRLRAKLVAADVPLAIWSITATAGVLALLGIAVVAMCPWDQMFYSHNFGAGIFFSSACAFMFGLTTCAAQLEDENAPYPKFIKVTRIFTLIALVCMVIGGSLYLPYGPKPPCPEEVQGERPPIEGTCVEYGPDHFAAFCNGDLMTHSHFLGNLCAVMEWCAFGTIMAAMNVYIFYRSEQKGDGENQALI